MALKTNFYDNQIYFALVYQGFRTEIIEPDKWNTIQNHIPRDKNSFGFMSDFLEDEYGLRFTFIRTDRFDSAGNRITGGGDMIRGVVETIGQGPQSYMYFEIGYKQNFAYFPVNFWKLKLDEYECEDPGGVMVPIEKMPFQSKLKSRMNSPVPVNSYFTADAGVLSQISSWTLRLHSKTILETSQGISNSPQRPNEYSSPAGVGGGRFNTLWLTTDTSNMTLNELRNVFTQPSNLATIGPNSPCTPAQVFPFADFISQYNALTSGVLNISYKALSMDFYLFDGRKQLNPAELTGEGSEWIFTPQIVQQRNVDGTWTIINTFSGTPISITSGTTGYSFGSTVPVGVLPTVTDATDRTFCVKVSGISFDFEQNNIVIEQGDYIYCHMVVVPALFFTSGDLLAVQFDNYLNNILYTQLTITPSSNALAYRAFDVLNQQLEFITGQKNALESTYFSEGGEGYNLLLTNGYAIRNFGGPGYEMRSSLEETLKSLQASEAIGWGIKRMQDGTEHLVVEYFQDFFTDKLIGVFPDSFEWKDKYGSDWCFNEAELGYNKYEGLNIVQQDEFNTKSKYLLQYLQTEYNTFTKLSNHVASGYLIEEQRRNQFLDNQQQNLTNDADVFIIQAVIASKFPNLICEFSSSGNSVGFHVNSMAMLPGDTFSYTIVVWVSMQKYVSGNKVDDPGSGFFRCTASVITSNIPPHLDVGNWTPVSPLNSGRIFTVVSEVTGYPIIGLDAYNVTPTPLDEIPCVDIIINPSSPNVLFSERTDPFQIVTNCIDPSTIYNGRKTPKHILYKWMPLLGIGLYFIDVNSTDYQISQIVTTEIKMNALFTTQFLSTEQFKGNAGVNIISEIQRELIKNFLKNGKILFTPFFAECKIKIGWNEMNIIRLALSGEFNDPLVDRGGIVLNDSRGIYWFCHVLDIKYDLVKEIATLQVAKVNKVYLSSYLRRLYVPIEGFYDHAFYDATFFE